MQKKNNKETMKRVLKYIRKYTPALVLSLLLAGLTVLLTLYIPILTGNAVDLIIGEGQVDMPDIFAIMKKIAIVMIITAVGQWVMNTCNNYITYHVIRDIRTDAFAKLEILPLKYLDAHAYGDIVSRVIADVDTFADGLLMGFTQLFTGVLTILCTLGFMLVTNVPITLVVVCITPVHTGNIHPSDLRCPEPLLILLHPQHRAPEAPRRSVRRYVRHRQKHSAILLPRRRSR